MLAEVAVLLPEPAVDVPAAPSSGEDARIPDHSSMINPPHAGLLVKLKDSLPDLLTAFSIVNT
jgi:hypothetical protein